jgi:hypothetical protein
VVVSLLQTRFAGQELRGAGYYLLLEYLRRLPSCLPLFPLGQLKEKKTAQCSECLALPAEHFQAQVP